MIISLKTPEVRPAVAAKTFSDIWILGLDINLPIGEPGRAIVTWLPWDSVTNTVHTGVAPRQFTVPDLVGKLGSDPGFQAVWEAVTSYLAAHMAVLGIAEEPEI